MARKRGGKFEQQAACDVSAAARPSRLVRSAPPPGPRAVRRGEDSREVWPVLLPLKVELLIVKASAIRTSDDDPTHVEHLFAITLNDPAATRLLVPVVVTAAQAATPGVFDEADAVSFTPDYHHAAWETLGRFAESLAHLSRLCGPRAFDTPYSRWTDPGGRRED